MKRQAWLFLVGVILLLSVSGCISPRVEIPPKIDLREYERVGIISLTSNAEGNLDEFATQEFLEAITEDQKVGIIELGDGDSLLRSVGQRSLNPNTLRAIGEKYSVGAVILGNLEISDVRPMFKLSSLIKHIGVKAEVEAFMTAKLLETDYGATVWTDSARDTETVAGITIFPGGRAFFDARDAEEAYGDLVGSLIRETTVDFRVTYERR